MANTPTLVVYQATGAQTDFVFPFAYLNAAHIKATVNGVATAFTLISQNTVRFSPAPNGEVRIFRETPGQALVVWNDGAVILGKNLNTSSTQPRFIAEEARDIAQEAREIADANIDDALQAVQDAQGHAAQALNSATAAANSAAQAAATKTLVEGIYDSFDDRYLGIKPSDPTTDNDGNALLIGAVYFNTTLQELRVFTSAGWVAAYLPVNPDGVSSFNGRTGAVNPASGDYGVSQITGLQTALDGKAPTTHDHAGQAIVPNTLRWTRASQLTGTVDLNTVLTAGFYDVSAATNKPAGSSNWGYLLVEVHSNSTDFAKQTWTDLDTAGAGHWIRTRTSGVWGPWQRTQTAGKQTIWVSAAAMLPNGANPPLNVTVIAGSNVIVIHTRDFDATSEEYLYFTVAMPKGWDEGSLSFEVVWSHAATTTNFGVRFDLFANAFSNDDPLAQNAIAPGFVIDTGGTTDDLYVSPESAPFTVAGSPAEGDTVFFRFNRVPGNASDTLAVDARVHGIRLFYTTNAATDA